MENIKQNQGLSKNSENFRVLLYFKYVPIDDPEKFAKEHLAFCKANNLKGRILVAKQGLNGTVAGTLEATEKYKQALWADPRFSDIEFKEGYGDESTFKKIFVRVRDELVTLRVPGVDPQKTGKFLSPAEFNEMVENDPDIVIVDMRNLYEYQLGHFKNAIPMKMDNFKELPEAVREIENYKNKKVVTYCTGGIRCVPATAYLKQIGFKEVYQLDGGIIKYSEESPDKHFEGSCFVFDGRMSVPINKTKNLVISNCKHCGESCDVYINCCNAQCNALFICCENCANKMSNACSDECIKYQRDPDYKDYMTMIQKRYAASKAQ